MTYSPEEGYRVYMDEEAEYRAAIRADWAERRDDQAHQGPLMTFFAEAIELEAALVTQKEILCEFERIMRAGLPDAQKKRDDCRKRSSGICKRMPAWWRAVLDFIGPLRSRKEHREALDAQSQASWAAKEKRLHSAVMDMQEKTRRALDALYAGSGLPDRYRTLPALACFYEYFQEGRCNTLSGGEGAYSVFDAQVRTGTVAAQADEAWARREAIGRHHPLLSRRLTQIHETARRVAQEAAQAGDGEDLAQLAAWSAFVRSVQQAASWQKMAEK